MMWLFLGLFILFLLIAIMIISKLKVYLSVYHGQDNDHVVIVFKAWGGIIKYKIEIPLIKIDTKSPGIVFEEKVETGPGEQTTKDDMKKFTAEDFLKSINDAMELLNHVVNMHKIVKDFLKKVRISKFEWYSHVGIGDAAHTGILSGAVWTVKGSLIGLLSTYMRLIDSPVISVTPDFQQAISQTRLTCMFQFRIGHAMLAGIKLIKYWKGGKPKFKTKRLSILSGNKTKSV